MLPMLDSLELALGLHQTVEIIYVVDGYVAKLVNEQDRIIADCQSKTMIGALIDLNNAVKGMPHAS